MSKGPPPEGFDENPEWTEQDFARARPASQMVSPQVLRALVRNVGRETGPSKQQVTLRLDREALERFRAGGPGWQTRINEAVRKAAGL